MSSPMEPENVDMTVNFACKRCCQPLTMQSALSINQHNLKELSNQLGADVPRHRDVETDVDVPKQYASVTYKMVPPNHYGVSSSNGNGFLVIGDSNVLSSSSSTANGNDNSSANAHTRNNHMSMTFQLFDILSEQTDVDHPLCEECADFVIDQMDNQLRLLEEECREYREYHDTLETNQQSCNDDEEIAKLKARFDELQCMESQLMGELKQIEDEQKHIDLEIDKQNCELQRLYNDEERYWHEYNNLRNTVYAYDDEQQSVENQLRYVQSQFDKLKKTDVFNATFHIWHSGQFGTINNFRLGRLPNVPVEWAEINAAWGQAALLLHSLAKKINLNFQRYKLVPYGNHSFLESLDDKSKELPLYASGGFRYFWNSKFDQAMVAFLDCLQQFKEEVEKGDSGFCLPYRMERGKIEDTKTGNSYSIKIQFNSEEQWTKALKFMLTNLKWALAWVSSQFNKS